MACCGTSSRWGYSKRHPCGRPTAPTSWALLPFPSPAGAPGTPTSSAPLRPGFSARRGRCRRRRRFCKLRPPGSSPIRLPPPPPLAAAVLSHGPPPSAPSRARAGFATRSAPSPRFTAPARGAAPPTRPRVGLVCAGVESAPPLRARRTSLTAVQTLCAAAAPTQPSLAFKTRPKAVKPIRSLQLLGLKCTVGYVPPCGRRPQGMETNQRSEPRSVLNFSYKSALRQGQPISVAGVGQPLRLRSRLRKHSVCCTWSVPSWSSFARAAVLVLGSRWAAPAQCAFVRDPPGLCEKDRVQLGAFDAVLLPSAFRSGLSAVPAPASIALLRGQKCTTTPGFTKNYLRSLFFAAVLKIESRTLHVVDFLPLGCTPA